MKISLSTLIRLIGIMVLAGTLSACPGDSKTSSNADSETFLFDENGNPRLIINEDFNSNQD